MKNSTIKKIIFSILGILTLLLIYIIISKIKNNELLFPSLTNIFKETLNIIFNFSSLKLIINVILRVLLVILISILITIIISFIYYLIPEIDYFFKPINNILKSIPFVIVSLYLYIIFFKNRQIILYIISFMVVFPIIYEGIIGYLRNFDKRLSDDLKLLTISPFNKFFYGYLPLSIPSLLIALLQSIGLCFKVVIMTEYLCQVPSSIGQIINDSMLSLEYTKILGWLVVIVMMVCILDIIINILINKIKRQSKY